MIGVGSVLSDLGRLCFYQLKPVSTLTALGWSLLHHHPVDVCGIFLAWKSMGRGEGKNREGEGREGRELEEEEEGRGGKGRKRGQYIYLIPVITHYFCINVINFTSTAPQRL